MRLLDFGLALMQEAETLTAQGDVPGTLAYISPERLAGDEATEAADIWAVGVMLWESLAGRHPFWQSSMLDTARAIEQGRGVALGAAPRSAEAADPARRQRAVAQPGPAPDRGPIGGRTARRIGPAPAETPPDERRRQPFAPGAGERARAPPFSRRPSPSGRRPSCRSSPRAGRSCLRSPPPRRPRSGHGSGSRLHLRSRCCHSGMCRPALRSSMPRCDRVDRAELAGAQERAALRTRTAPCAGRCAGIASARSVRHPQCAAPCGAGRRRGARCRSRRRCPRRRAALHRRPRTARDRRGRLDRAVRRRRLAFPRPTPIRRCSIEAALLAAAAAVLPYAQARGRWGAAGSAPRC